MNAHPDASRAQEGRHRDAKSPRPGPPEGRIRPHRAGADARVDTRSDTRPVRGLHRTRLEGRGRVRRRVPGKRPRRAGPPAGNRGEATKGLSTSPFFTARLLHRAPSSAPVVIDARRRRRLLPPGPAPIIALLSQNWDSRAMPSRVCGSGHRRKSTIKAICY